MAKYTDGFVIPIPKNKIDAYRAIAEKAGAIWRDHGALDYKECVGEDLEKKELGNSFLAGIGTKPDETVVFAWIVFNSREHRDEVNARVMADPRMNDMCKEGEEPFDLQRMLYGGFEVIVDA